MYTETKRSILGRRNTKTKKMHKEGLSKLAGAIAERRKFVTMIDDLQIELNDGKIDIHDFYDLIVLLKEDLQDGII